MPLALPWTTAHVVIAIYTVSLGTSVIGKDCHVYVHLVVIATQLRTDAEARLPLDFKPEPLCKLQCTNTLRILDGNHTNTGP